MKERMRGFAKLLICLRRRSNCHLTLEEALQPRYFDSIIECVREICKWKMGDKDHPPSFKNVHRALKLGHGLKKAAAVRLGRAMKEENMSGSRRQMIISDFMNRSGGTGSVMELCRP